MYNKLCGNDRGRRLGIHRALLPGGNAKVHSTQGLSTDNFEQYREEGALRVMTRTSLTIFLAATLAASVGYASKKYVRNEAAALIKKRNERDDVAAKKTKGIKDVDARAEAGMQGVQGKAAEGDQK